MDEFDFKEDKPAKKSRKFGAAIWNLASTLLVLATLCIGAFFVFLFLNPQSQFNPLPPVTNTPAVAATQTSILPTAEATLEPTATPTATPEPTSTPEPITMFGIQEGSPVALDASVFHPELACNFMGVAGQAFGLDDAPITGLRVQVTGTLNGEAVDKLGLTGAATQYGPGAYYEIQLADAPSASEGTLQIAVFNEAGQNVTAATAFSTFADCTQNLILINFKQLP
jgi:hypothetical protein